MVTPLVHGQAVQGAAAHLPAAHGPLCFRIMSQASSQPSDLDKTNDEVDNLVISYWIKSGKHLNDKFKEYF